MSMAAKLSDLVDKMSEANLQADGQTGKASPRSGGPMGDEKKRTVPLSTCTDVVPCPEAAIRLPQYKTLLGNMSDFNR